MKYRVIEFKGKITIIPDVVKVIVGRYETIACMVGVLFMLVYLLTVVIVILI
jgi:hypothetical protein